MTRWLCVWSVIAALVVTGWDIQDRLTKLEQVKVQEEQLKRLVTQEMISPLLEQASAMQRETVVLQQEVEKLSHPIPEYPRGRKTHRWTWNGRKDIPGAK